MSGELSGTSHGDLGSISAAVRALQVDQARLGAARRLAATAGDDTGLQMIATLAAELLGTPSAEVSVITDERIIVAAVDALPGPVGTRTALDTTWCTAAAASRCPFVIHDATADPRLEGVDRTVRAAVGGFMSAPMAADDGNVVGAVCVYQPQPRNWSQHEVALLQRLASAAAGQLEVARLRADYQQGEDDAAAELLVTAARAAGLGPGAWDLSTGAVSWGPALLDVFGYDNKTFPGTIEAFDTRVHRDDLPAVHAALQEAIDTCGTYEAEFRVLRPDGTARRLITRGHAVPGPDGRAVQLLGAATDVTALRQSQADAARALESLQIGFVATDAAGRVTRVNSTAERMLDRPSTEAVGRPVAALFDDAGAAQLQAVHQEAATAGRSAAIDVHRTEPNDAWLEVRAVPDPDGVALYLLDVSHRRATRAAIERSEQRARLLADLANELAETLDPIEALQAGLRILVPALADWGVVSLLDEGPGKWRDRLRDVAAWHPDPAQRAIVEEYRTIRAPALAENSPVARALATGRPAHVALGTGAERADVLAPGRAQELLAQLDPGAALVLPLRGRGHIRGFLTLVNGVARGSFTTEELRGLREVTGQIGVALDNAHLHTAHRHVAEELQRSLLTALPEPDHLHLVARYVPTAAETGIGGDWYDAFLVRDGSTCLVVGDVTGHDLQAAITMAQLRNVLRGGAHAVVQPPAAILEGLDWAMHDLAIGQLATAVLAKVEQSPEHAEQGLRVLRWSNAGHLPPLLLHPDGRAELLSRPADLLLGLHTTTPRSDHTHTLHPGSTVLLYTDGLVERRGEHLGDGLERLRRTAEELAALPLEEFCDQLLTTLAQDGHDDVALLAVRAHPEDQARPDEAGPQVLPQDLAER